MKYIESPTKYEKTDKNPSIFLAGGITDCPDWQKKIVGILKDSDVTLINPRRKDFDVSDPKASNKQIKWEYEHLRKVSAISFWFPKETLCPITLFELGYWFDTFDKVVFIGIHPDYKRRNDIIKQVSLKYPKFKFYDSIEELGNVLKEWLKQIKIIYKN
jgi:hypothetical protein